MNGDGGIGDLLSPSLGGGIIDEAPIFATLNPNVTSGFNFTPSPLDLGFGMPGGMPSGIPSGMPGGMPPGVAGLLKPSMERYEPQSGAGLKGFFTSFIKALAATNPVLAKAMLAKNLKQAYDKGGMKGLLTLGAMMKSSPLGRMGIRGIMDLNRGASPRDVFGNMAMSYGANRASQALTQKALMPLMKRAYDTHGMMGVRLVASLGNPVNRRLQQGIMGLLRKRMAPGGD
tara:strand:+ start:3558 stop:4247 length:690 start_codon:yes stop_codon:yes gene_type:complete